METREKAILLVDCRRQLNGFKVVRYMDGNYGHMGATITDAILQAGTNYKTVAWPRVQRVRRVYPDAVSTSAFLQLITKEGIKRVLNWSDDEEPNRVLALTQFFLAEGIETESDLAKWLAVEANLPRLRKVRGMGPKTVDYLKILAGMQTAAADRYVFRLLEECGAAASDYEEARDILNLAADAMGVERALFDHSIWQYMSKRER